MLVSSQNGLARELQDLFPELNSDDILVTMIDLLDSASDILSERKMDQEARAIWMAAIMASQALDLKNSKRQDDFRVVPFPTAARVQRTTSKPPRH